MSDVKRKIWDLMRGQRFRGYLRRTSAYPAVLADCMKDSPVSIAVSGNAVQDGTPTPDNPAEVQGVGDRTGNLFDVKKFKEISCLIPSAYEAEIDAKKCVCVRIADIAEERYGNFFSNIDTNEQFTFCLDIKNLHSSQNSVIVFLKYEDGTVSSIPQNIRALSWLRMSIVSTADKRLVGFYMSYYGNWEIAISCETAALVKGSYTADTMPPYELYGYKVPVQFGGKNLFNKDRQSGTATSYEPVIFPIYLDAPLYRLGDAADSVTLDFDHKTAVRTDCVRELQLTSGGGVYRIMDNNIRFFSKKVDVPGVFNSPMLSDKLPAYGRTSWTIDQEDIFFHDARNTPFYISLNKARIGYEDGDIGEALMNKCNAYLADNPMMVYYQRLNPVTTDISDQIDWNQFPAFWRGTVTVSAGATVPPSEITVGYYADKPE